MAPADADEVHVRRLGRSSRPLTGEALMGIMDKAKQMADKVTHSGKAEEYIDKARDKAGDMTGHKYDDQINKGSDMAKGAMKKGNQPDQPDQQQ